MERRNYIKPFIPTPSSQSPPLQGRGLWAVILLLWGILLSCQSAPETISRPDWADVTLYATGFGAIPKWTPEDRIRGIQAAKIGAARQLEEKMLLLTTDSGEPFREKVIKEKLMQKVSAYVREAEVVAIENKPEGVEILSRLSLGDPFKAALGLLKRKELSPPQRLQEGSY